MLAFLRRLPAHLTDRHLADLSFGAAEQALFRDALDRHGFPLRYRLARRTMAKSCALQPCPESVETM